MKTIFPAVMAGLSLVSTNQLSFSAELGDKAPPLQIAEWVKGKPVDIAAGKGKTVFVIEFWATWCPPCRASIPHLTELQKKFKDKGVVVVGISDEKLATVKPFVEKMGDKMEYTVAVDTDRKTSEGYMEAFGINGIPHAFIVDKEGRIVWSGHPMGDLAKSLDQVLDGKFDIEMAKKREVGRKKLEEFFELANNGEDDAKLDKLGKEIEALDKEIGGIEPGEKFDAAEIRKMAKFQKAMIEYQQAVQEGKSPAEVEKLAKAAEAVAPKGFNFADVKSSMESQQVFAGYYAAITEGSDKAKIAELGKKLGAANVKIPQLLNEWAWTILTDEKVKDRDLPLAAKLAKAAVDASGSKDAAILDTYARALFDTGKVTEAVDLENKAVELCEDAEMKKDLETNLKKYQAKAGAK